MSHRPTNPWARQTGLLTPATRKIFERFDNVNDVSEIIPDHLWQSGEPTPELLKQIRPNHIVDCRWFDDDNAKLPMDMPKLSSIADAVTTLVRSGQRVLIHCLAGINRSSLLMCLVLLRLYPTWTGIQAVKYLETKRPGVLTNQLFRTYLSNLNATESSSYMG